MCLGSSDNREQRKVVHLAALTPKVFTNLLRFSVICPTYENLCICINELEKSLFFGHLNEPGQKQRKFRALGIFSARLSTETVDSFSLACCPPIIAGKSRIDPAQGP
jgi:hypothetical protein